MSYNSYEYKSTSNLRILNLVLYSEQSDYIDMYHQTREFYLSNGIDTIYYLHDPTLSTEYHYDSNTNLLRIRGEETYVPGILQKTIKAFRYAIYYLPQYDYIFRTNISTVVDFRRLIPLLEQSPIEFGCGKIHQIQPGWRDVRGGITDERYHGIRYPFGTCIIFSGKLLKRVLEKIDNINYTLIDDVSIGQFMLNYFSDVKLKEFDSVFVHMEYEPEIEKKYKQFMIYRHRHDDRKKDVEKMKWLINRLSQLSNYRL